MQQDLKVSFFYFCLEVTLIYQSPIGQTSSLDSNLQDRVQQTYTSEWTKIHMNVHFLSPALEYTWIVNVEIEVPM